MSNIAHRIDERGFGESTHDYEVMDSVHLNQSYEDINGPPGWAMATKLRMQQNSTSADDYDLTQCPAYVPVGSHDNRQTETLLMAPSNNQVDKTQNKNWTESDKANDAA